LSSQPPKLIGINEYGGDWERYKDALYDLFCADFIARKPVFRSKPVVLAERQKEGGKEKSFWHLISGGGDSPPYIRRCERIGFCRFLIENADTDQARCWKRLRERRVCIALPDFSYLVVLEERKTHWIFITGYYIESERKRQKHRKSFDDTVQKD
jgi:hypothetical protein